MDYIKAFIIGGIICALTQILLDRTKLMPGRTIVWVWEPSLERGPRCCRSGRIHRSIPGRIQSQCSRYQRSINIRISRIIDIQS